MRGGGRGSFLLFGLAFAALVGAAAAVAVASAGFLASLTTLRLSVGLSALAAVLAIASLLLPRR